MLSSRFLRLSVLFALVGMGLGIIMAASGDHTQTPTHAHINLLGFVSMFLFGLFYKVYPEAQTGRLPMIHFWLSFLGLILIGFGLSLFMAGIAEAEIGAVIGSMMTILSMVLFTIIVFKATSSAPQ